MVLQRNLDCWGETTSAVNSDTRPDADRHRQKHQKRSRRDEDETSSSSSSSSSSGRERRKRERKKERKQEKRKAKKEKREKKEKTEKKKKKKARKERKAEDRENDTHRQLPSVYAPPPPDVAEEAPPATPEACSLPGAKRPEQAEAERVAGQRIVTVWDPSLGIERSVRANGEVSRSTSRQLQHDKARHVPTVAGPTRTLGPAAAGPERDTGPGAYTGRDKFPSQHPWFGYK